jgi:hypothetical protein
MSTTEGNAEKHTTKTSNNTVSIGGAVGGNVTIGDNNTTETTTPEAPSIFTVLFNMIKSWFTRR